MHNTEADNSIEIGGVNQYQDGPPGTTLTADDRNTLQKEIVHVIESAGLTLKTAATENNTQLKEAISLLITQETQGAIKATDWTSKNLVMSNPTNTTLDVDADELSFINSIDILAFGSNINTTFDIAADLMAGTSEKASTWYQLWLDSAGVRLMVPDLESVADANVANSLSDSAATFITDLVQVDDVIYQTTDGTIGYVKAVSTENVITIKDAAGADLDLFPLGTESYKIRMLSPVGLGSFRARIGAAFNDAGSDLYDSTYAQIQEEKYYNGDGTDYDLSATPAGWVLTDAPTYIKQVNDWTGRGYWKYSANINAALTASTIADITIEGVEFSVLDQAIGLMSSSLVAPISGYAGGVNAIIARFSANVTSASYTIDIILKNKPTYHK
jgi:hypothetical protein